MITLNSAAKMLDMLAGKSAQPISMNADVVAHQQDTPVAAPDAWPLRLIPGFVRGPLKARIAARKYERSLIRLWDTSPHLLQDMGVVLTTSGELPGHLVPAPARVMDHVAALAPEQIADADLRFPAAPAAVQVAAEGAAQGARTNRAFHLAGAV